MPVQEFDLIQRIRVEDGVPRVISTTVKVIEGKSETGNDLLSLALDILQKIGFYEEFVEKKTSQYIGYRFKNPKKGLKRYQLVLSQRKDRLYVSLPSELIDDYDHGYGLCLVIPYETGDYPVTEWQYYWVLPSESELFLEELAYDSGLDLDGKVIGTFETIYHNYEFPSCYEERGLCIKLEPDPLFPYLLQGEIKYPDVLEECLTFFGQVLMESDSEWRQKTSTSSKNIKNEELYDGYAEF